MTKYKTAGNCYNGDLDENSSKRGLQNEQDSESQVKHFNSCIIPNITFQYIIIKSKLMSVLGTSCTE